MLSSFTASFLRRRLGMPGPDQRRWYTFKCPPTPGTFSTAHEWYTLRARRGQHRYNRYLLDVAKHYGVKIRLCSPYRAQTKGKVERFHRYLRESFFVPLQSGQTHLVDVATANRECRIWLSEIANVRIHATLKERPLDRLAVERPALRALPLPYAGLRALEPRIAISVPVPLESLQHPLVVYQTLAEELA